MKTILEPDACDLLDADHVAVEFLFLEYRRLTGSRTPPALKKRAGLARDICLILAVHARLEHEVFYPALQAALSVADILAEAQVEHECAHYLMVRIEQKADVDIVFDARSSFWRRATKLRHACKGSHKRRQGYAN